MADEQIVENPICGKVRIMITRDTDGSLKSDIQNENEEQIETIIGLLEATKFMLLGEYVLKYRQP